MAKQKSNNTEGEITLQEEVQSSGTNDTQKAVETQVVLESKVAPKEDIKSPVPTERSSFTDEILKSYPEYESLYIDSHGGCFTNDTPSVVRGKAILYKNPYYKS